MKTSTQVASKGHSLKTDVSECVLPNYQPQACELEFLEKLPNWEAKKLIGQVARVEVIAIVHGGITSFHESTSSERQFLVREAQRCGFELFRPRLKRA
ncbi:MAG TPA: hypothetical protein VMH91_00405 [Candidatus Paceibacterota bacterium]|nr:hypothetical protein [Candidatus Paceibacterota bacterium]